jgi:hypothetical protein
MATAPRTDRDDILKALKEEIEAVDKADGKGVASKDPKEISGLDDAGKSSKVKLSGGGGTVGGEGGGGGKAGKPAEGAEKPAIDKADGKSVASAKTGDAKVTGGTDGKALEKADGKSVAAATSKISPDLKGMDNAVGESITLPHDVLVEMDGKQTTLKAGTKVRVVKEEEECKEEEKEEKEEKKEKKVDESKVVKEDELPGFMKGEEEEGEEAAPAAPAEGEEAAEGGEGGEGLFGEDDIPAEVSKIESPEGVGEIEKSSLDKIVDSLDNLASGFAEFAAEEQGEPQHGGEGEAAPPVPAPEKEMGEGEFATQLESIIKRAGKTIK